MIRRKGPILAAAVIAAFALGWYRGLFGTGPATTDAPSAPSAPTQITAETGGASKSAESASAVPPEPEARQQAEQGAAPAAVSGPDASSATNAQTAVAPTPTPGFDVVRVEPDGSAVVAGRGAANERIALTDGTRTLGETQTDANGDFVMSLSIPKGSHRLQLAQRDDVVSDDAAVVNVPPPGRPDQLLVMMERPGEASEVLQRPRETATASEATATLPAASPQDEAAETGEEQLAATRPTGADASATPDAPAATAMPASPAAPAVSNVSAAQGSAAASASPLSVEAVEIEGSRLFVAGSAARGSSVRVYLDDAFVGEARTGSGDRFVANAQVDVPVGDHRIRADALDASGRVIGRVEVPFQRPEGTSMAAVAAPPAATPPIDASSAATPAPDSTQTKPSSGEPDAVIAASPPPPSGASAPPAVGDSTPTSPTTAPNEGPSMAEAQPQPQPDAAVGTAGSLGEPATVVQAPLQASASRVIIRRGDTLWRISRDTYGRGSRYTVIYLANGDQIRDPDRIYPGQVFRVPDASDATEAPRG